MNHDDHDPDRHDEGDRHTTEFGDRDQDKTQNRVQADQGRHGAHEQVREPEHPRTDPSVAVRLS